MLFSNKQNYFITKRGYVSDDIDELRIINDIKK